MKAKKYLQQIQRLSNHIERLKDEAKEYERLANSVPGQTFDRERVDCTRNLEAPFVKWIYKKIEKEEEIAKAEKKLLEIKSVAEGYICKINDVDLRLLLIYRYFNFYSWSQIASKMYVSMSTVYRYHELALDSFDELLKIDS